MNAEQAREAISQNQQYKSADFYRMQNSPSIALAVFDDVNLILNDLIVHGDTEAQNLLAQFHSEGIVVIDQSQGLPQIYFNNEWNNTVQSQMAMQIAFPQAYRNYFQGENVWDVNDARFIALLDLCAVAMAGTHKYTSDFFGEHLTLLNPEQDPTPISSLQPPNPAIVAKKPPSEWVRVRDEYNATVSSLWANYLDLCRERREKEAELRRVRDEKLREAQELSRLASQEYNEAATVLAEGCNFAKQEHADYKYLNKPNRQDYE